MYSVDSDTNGAMGKATVAFWWQWVLGGWI